MRFSDDECRWPGLQSYCTIIDALCLQTAWSHVHNRFTCTFFYVCTFTCTVLFFIGFVIAKSVIQFLHYCILAFFRLRSYVCTRLFVCLVGWFFCVLVLCIYIIDCLIFCTSFLYYFIYIFYQNVHFCNSCFLQVFLDTTSAFCLLF